MVNISLILLALLGIFVLVTVIKTMYTVRTATVGVVERFGKFNRIVRPGLHACCPTLSVSILSICR